MSLAAIEEMRADSLYLSTGGGWAPATEAAIRALAARPGPQLVAATDNNARGDLCPVEAHRCGDGLRLAESSCPLGDDWNADLRK
jgi:hypothetical protein